MTVVLVSGCTVAEMLDMGDKNVVDVTVPDEQAKPGSTVAIGDTVRVPGEDTDGTRGDVGLTVLSITKGDKSLYKDMDNAEEFKDYTPWLVVTQVNDAPGASELKKPDAAPLYGVDKDGNYADFLTVERENGKYEARSLCTDVPRSSKPGVLGECDVILVHDKTDLSHFEWDGTVMNEFGLGAKREEPKYSEKPLRWNLPR